jgi:membrane-bound lytic murein transglycosylase MltF
VELVAAPEQLQDEDLMEMLNAGLTEMLVVDDYKAVLWSSVFPNLKLHHDITINTGGETAWMFRKDCPILESAINEFAGTHKQGTLHGNILVSRYVDKSRFIKNALAPGETERFRKVVELFRLYGDRYDLNHLLLMAQAYQESGLDQQAKSHVGAVGIMQLMPATGKQMNVGDIRQLEPNIHAGVKYVRHIIDHYLRDEPMDELNMTLFAFAAYNAGPNRINKLRQAAKEADLDPNLWFNNVEVLAARKVGSETVAYVSNIFKYYVAFKLVQEEEAEKSRAKESLQSAR